MSGFSVSRGLSREYSEDGSLATVQSQRAQVQVQEALGRIASQLFARGVAVFGTADTSQPGGITDGITFTTGQTRDIYHGLGRKASGFIIIDRRTSQPELLRATTGLDTQLEKSHIRLTHGGASTTVVKLWVW